RGEDTVSLGRWLWDGIWLQRLWEAFETKPAMASAFGLAVCGMVIAGVIYSDSDPANNQRAVAGSVAAQPSAPWEVAQSPPPLFAASPAATPVAMESTSISGVSALPARASLFNELPQARPQTLEWKVPGGN